MSACLLLVGLWLFISKARSSKSLPVCHSELEWALNFILAMGLLSMVGFLQINLLPSLAINRLIVALESIISLAYILWAIRNKYFFSYLLAPFRNESRFFQALSGCGFFVIALFSLLTSSPLNWDSNAYNVARVATMLADSTTFLSPSTASSRQAIYSIGHDLLFYPDIAFGILRGLPLVCVLQFFVLLGVLLTIKRQFFCQLKINSLKNTRTFRAASLSSVLIIIFLFGSNQQVMQSVITKNDLSITLLFCASLSFAADILGECKNNKESLNIALLTPMVVALCVATYFKSYGLILFIPLASTLLVLIFNHSFLHILRLPRVSSIVGGGPLFLCISLVIILYLQSSITANLWSDDLERIYSITSYWENSGGDIWVRFENALINLQRIILQGVLFPMTALKPYMPIGVELQSPISPEIIPSHLRGSNASSTGDFMLLYGTNPDMAYPFLITQLGVVSGVVSAFFHPRLRHSGLFSLVVCSSLLCLLAFPWALFYQHFISRFLGPVYIPLLAVASVSLGILFDRILPQLLFSSAILRFACQVFVSLLALLPLFSSISLTGYLSSRAGMPQGNADFYEQYLWDQKGLSRNSAREFVDKLKNGDFNKRIFCSKDGHWTLTPMVLSQKSASFEENVRLYNYSKCAQDLREKGLEPVLVEAQVLRVGNTDYIDLP